jgi:hypothetical protein
MNGLIRKSLVGLVAQLCFAACADPALGDAVVVNRCVLILRSATPSSSIAR